jgi:DNA polymerase (family 10)
VKLDVATAYAERIKSELAPFCEPDGIEIAGSIRRRRPEPNDIDLVVLPRDLAGLRARLFQNGPAVLRDGEEIISIKLRNDVQVDVFLASNGERDFFHERPANFGSVLLCRTGSAKFNIWLCAVAKARGYHWNPHWGLYKAGRCMASATEEEIFHRLGIDFLKPELREK